MKIFLYILALTMISSNDFVHATENNYIELYEEAVKLRISARPLGTHDPSTIGNYQESFKKMKVAADSGISDAQYELAQYYRYGIGVKPNMEEALKYYEKAVDNLHPKACNDLGVYFEFQKGDKKEALILYEMSWMGGDSSGKSNFERLKKKLEGEI